MPGITSTVAPRFVLASKPSSDPRLVWQARISPDRGRLEVVAVVELGAETFVVPVLSDVELRTLLATVDTCANLAPVLRPLRRALDLPGMRPRELIRAQLVRVLLRTSDIRRRGPMNEQGDPLWQELRALHVQAIPRYSTRHGRCVLCNEGATAIRPFGRIWWAACQPCALRWPIGLDAFQIPPADPDQAFDSDMPEEQQDLHEAFEAAWVYELSTYQQLDERKP